MFAQKTKTEKEEKRKDENRIKKEKEKKREKEENRIKREREKKREKDENRIKKEKKKKRRKEKKKKRDKMFAQNISQILGKRSTRLKQFCFLFIL